MRGGGQEKIDMIQSGCTFFLTPVFYEKGTGRRSPVSFLLGWEKEKRSIDKIKISGVSSISFLSREGICEVSQVPFSMSGHGGKWCKSMPKWKKRGKGGVLACRRGIGLP